MAGDSFLALRRMHVFAQLDEKALRGIAPYFVEETFAPSAIIFKEGDEAEFFYTIASGQVEVLKGELTDKPRRLALLNDADYFGEMGLAKHTGRNATVRAVKQTVVWKIDHEHFYTLMLRNPRVKNALDVAIQTRRYARQEKFHKWLRENEVVYLATLPHRVFIFPKIYQPSLVFSGALILSALLFFFRLDFLWQFIPFVVLIVGGAWLYWEWLDFHNDWYIVTSLRVIDIDKKVFFYESRAEAPLGIVQNTAIHTTEWGRQFDYGDVTINTFSGPIKFLNIPHPQAVSDLILEQLNRSRVQQKVAERNVLKSSLKLAMGIEKPPAPPPPKPPAPPPKPTFAELFLGWRKRLHLRSKELQGDSVVYRKHPIIFFQRTTAQILAVLLILFLYLLSLVNLVTRWMPMGLELLFIAWGGGLIPLAILGWNIGYEFIDWQNDVYMITATQIFDITRKPFGDEQRKTANIEAVANVSFLRPDFWANLLNYGTVTVNSGPGGEMKFINVYDPLSVQQDIYRRKEAREAAKALGAAKARHDEYAQYFGAFYEIVEEERKKREQEEKNKPTGGA